MNSERLELLKKYYNEDPQDPFSIYGLAIEYQKYDLSESRKYFEILLNQHADYLPTYYHVGHLYEDLNEEDLAIKAYKDGIEIARSQANEMTLRELKNALDELEYS